MKKFIAIILCIGLLTNSISAISMVRAFQCRPSSPNKNCSREELQAAQEWFSSASNLALGAMAAALAALGLIVGLSFLQQEKNKAQQLQPRVRKEDWSQIAERGQTAVQDVAFEQKRQKLFLVRSQISAIDEKLRKPGITDSEKAALQKEKSELQQQVFAM